MTRLRCDQKTAVANARQNRASAPIALARKKTTTLPPGHKPRKERHDGSTAAADSVVFIMEAGVESKTETLLSELATREVVYRIPRAAAVQRRHLTYRAASDIELPMAIYSPPSRLRQSVPAVVLAFGYADPVGRILNFGPVTSWARLLAASGIAAVLYGAAAPADDIQAVLHHLRRHAESLNLDAERTGLLATSGSGPVALSAVMRNPNIRCAAVLYGYTMDLDGGTAVNDMARQAGFVNACEGRTVDDLPATVPILFLRAGQDSFPSLNDLLDSLVARALMRNLPVTVVNHPTGVHGFDIYDDTVQSHRAIQHVLAFLQLHLVRRCRSGGA